MKREIKRQLNEFKWEMFRFNSDLIRVYNKYIRKQKSLVQWVEIK